MIDENDIAKTLQLFSSVGDAVAMDFMLADAIEITNQGRTDTATYLLDLSERFFKLYLEAKGDLHSNTEGLRIISISLRKVAQRLYAACGTKVDDGRLLKLVKQEP